MLIVMSLLLFRYNFNNIVSIKRDKFHSAFNQIITRINHSTVILTDGSAYLTDQPVDPRAIA